MLSRHTAPRGGGPDHYDWYLDLPVATHRLATFRVALPWHRWPTRLAAAAIDLVQLPPHRRRYLTYCGPVNRNGSVRVVARTTASIIQIDDSAIDLRLRTPALWDRRLRLRAVDAGWRLTAEAGPAPDARC